jgi:hypothetical protein
MQQENAHLHNSTTFVVTDNYHLFGCLKMALGGIYFHTDRMQCGTAELMEHMIAYSKVSRLR